MLDVFKDSLYTMDGKSVRVVASYYDGPFAQKSNSPARQNNGAREMVFGMRDTLPIVLYQTAHNTLSIVSEHP